jgi:hypothetical protein
MVKLLLIKFTIKGQNYMMNKQNGIAKAFIQGIVTDKVREVYDLYTLNGEYTNVNRI